MKMIVKFHDSEGKIVGQELDATDVKYTSNLVKFYFFGALVDVFSIGDLVKIEEPKDE